MKIGIDLDNTLIFYDEAFARAAIERGLLPDDFKGTKQQLRNVIRTLKDGETEWQRLQGYVYGAGLTYASLFPGVEPFLQDCKAQGHELFIVSHKTEFGHFDPQRINLRDAARGWLTKQGFFDRFGMKEINLTFATTRSEKVAAIAGLAPDWFIDDLVEVYEEPGFPDTTRKILFHSAPTLAPTGDWIVCHDWQNIARTVLT